MASSLPTNTQPAEAVQASVQNLPQFPPHDEPRVWFLTDGLSPIAISLSRYVLQHGDYVIAGISPVEFSGARGEELREFTEEIARERDDGNENDGVEMDLDPSDDAEGSQDDSEETRSKSKRPARKRWRERFEIVALDGRIVGQCQSAIAEALGTFEKIDILVICSSEALVGSIEELSQSNRAQSLVRDQFETNFFAPVNLIKSILPSMRFQRNGHIVTLTGITGHLGTPGLGMYCSSQWALEGYCDSLAYEVAPFNIKMTIVQPNLEITVLTNKIISIPQLPSYAPDVNPAPLSRDILSGLLDRLDGVSQDLTQTPVTTDFATPGSNEEPSTSPRSNNAPMSGSGDLLHADSISSLYPNLQAGIREALIKETVFALAAIGGHENPPARHIVGFEGVASVKEKLKTVSEELEDFVEVSSAVDIGVEGATGGREELGV